MISFANTVDIDRPAAEVFAYLADFTKVPTWNYYVEDVRKVTPGPVGEGTVYDQTRRTDRQRYEVITYRQPEELAVRTLPDERPAFTRTMRLESLGTASTRLRDAWELDTGHPRLVQRVSISRVKAGVAANLACLKELLEEGRTRLPDGRTMTLDQGP